MWSALDAPLLLVRAHYGSVVGSPRQRHHHAPEFNSWALPHALGGHDGRVVAASSDLSFQLTPRFLFGTRVTQVPPRQSLCFSLAQAAFDFLGDDIQRQQRLWPDLLSAEVAPG